MAYDHHHTTQNISLAFWLNLGFTPLYGYEFMHTAVEIKFSNECCQLEEVPAC